MDTMLHTTLRLRLPSGAAFACVAKPVTDPLPAALRAALSGPSLDAFVLWQYHPPPSNTLTPPPPLVVAHVLAGARGPDLRLAPDDNDPGSRAALEAAHRSQLEQGQAVVVRLADQDSELVLVPVKVKTGLASSAPGYWGFTLPSHLLSLAASVLHHSRLAVVLDLDETLIMAHTVVSLLTRLKRVKASK